jgi:O-antigen/teichoic acid export membrane protein
MHVVCSYHGRIKIMRPHSSKIPARTGLAAGVLLMTIATYLTYGVGVVTNAIIARGLAPADFGRYAFAVYISGVLVVISNNGLTTSGIRFIAESIGAGSLQAAQRTHGYLRRLSDYSQTAVLAVFLIGALIIRPLDWRAAPAVFIGVILVSSLAKARYLFDTSIAKGYSLFRIEAYSTVSIGLLTTLAAAALYLMHVPLAGYLALFACSSLGYWIAAAWQLRRAGVARMSGRPDATLLSNLLPHLRWTTLLTAVGVFGNKSVEVFVLNATRGAADVGFFAIGAALTRGGIDLLTSGLTTVLMPAMADAFGRGGQQQVNRIFMDSFRYLAFAGLLAAGVGFFLALPTVELLYGRAYLRAVTAFQVMVIVAGLTLGESALGAMLSTTDRQRSRAVLVAVQIALTVLLALILIPLYGFVGALLAHAASRLLGTTIVFGWVSRVYGITPPVPALLRLLAATSPAAAAGAGCVWLIGGPGGYVAAAIVYAGLLLPATLFARCWTPGDLDFAARAIDRLGARAAFLQRWTAGLAARFGA